MKTGLVLEGGGMRGLFSAGILDVMLENGINVDGVIGVSAGACFGCNYISRQVGRSLRYNLKYCKDSRYIGIKTWIRTGDYVGAKFAYHTMPKTLDIFDEETFDSNPTEFHVVVTDVMTGKPIYKRLDTMDDNMLEWVRASASMPLAAQIVHVGGGHYLDGGISDSIPLEHFQSIGFEKNIVVLTQPYDYRKRPTKMVPWLKIFMRKYPAIIDAMTHRHVMYNDELDYIHSQVSTGNTLLLYPDTALNISRVSKDRNKMVTVYEHGKRVAERRLDEIKVFLGR